MTEHSAAHSTFVVERTLNATPTRVFAAFSTEEGKQRWFGGGGDWAPLERTFDFRVGGSEILAGKWPNGTITRFDARYFDIVENERLVYTYDMHMNGNKISVSLATIELKSEGSKTHLKLTEQGVYLDGYDDAGQREHGTNILMDRLVAAFSEAAVKA
ncbi:MAG TPA: SRPBCC family protein [Caulobacteraceae bacterium]|nr:SRPBCC family protein [Caulobacteraceae bacterium]